MNPFKNDRQRKAAFANMKPKTPLVANDYMNDISTQISKIQNVLPKQNVLTNQNLTWIGCHAAPDQCLVIKGINEVYKIYKQKPPNRQYENKIETIIKIGTTNITSNVTKSHIEYYSKKVVEQANDSGLIDDISNKTHLNDNIIKDIIEGTTSNLLKDIIEKGTGFVVKKVI